MFDDPPQSETSYATIKRDVEALLFAAGSPLTLEVMEAAVGKEGASSQGIVAAVLAELSAEFPPGGSRGFELAHVAGGWIFRTNPAAQQAVAALFELPDDVSRLSPAAMEVLAIVAYLQPISRPQISEIRGVNSDSPLQKLLERELITEVGRSQAAGGAVLYGTTDRFEAMFGLSSLADLPDLEGFALTEEQKEELRRRLGLLSTPE